MSDYRLITTSSPHLHSGESVAKIMLSVALALLLPTFAGVYFFGFKALNLVIIASITAMVTEAIFQRLRNRPITIADGSALVTGMLLALNLPPGLPYWMAIVGAVVAISLGKQVYGGLGHNPFNPALIGRVFLMITFTTPMTTWINQLMVLPVRLRFLS